MKFVRDLMKPNIYTVHESKPISLAVEIMAKHGIGAVVVIDKQKNTVGIFTERDLLNRVVAKGVSVENAISEVMTKDLVCAQLHDTLEEIPELMLRGGFRHVPVVDNFEPVGMLSIRDILAYLRRNDF